MPPIKYVSGYQISKDIEAVLGCNSRTPELVVGDLRGQVGRPRRLRRKALPGNDGSLRQGDDSHLL